MSITACSVLCFVGICCAQGLAGPTPEAKEKSTRFLFWVIILLSGFGGYFCMQFWTEHSGWRLQGSRGGRTSTKKCTNMYINKCRGARTKKKYNNTYRDARARKKKHCGKNMLDVCCDPTLYDEYSAVVRPEMNVSSQPTCRHRATFATAVCCGCSSQVSPCVT